MAILRTVCNKETNEQIHGKNIGSGRKANTITTELKRILPMPLSGNREAGMLEGVVSHNTI